MKLWTRGLSVFSLREIDFGDICNCLSVLNAALIEQVVGGLEILLHLHFVLLCEQHPVIQLINLPLPLARPQSHLLLLHLPIPRRVRTLIIPAGLRLPQITSNLVRRNELFILINHRPAKTAFQNHYRRENESRSDFDERYVGFAFPDRFCDGLGRGGLFSCVVFGSF